MQAFSEFRQMPSSFWALVKFVSETIGYTLRKQGLVRAYSLDEIRNLLRHHNIPIYEKMILAVHDYCDMRAKLLNEYVQNMLMDSEAAREAFEYLWDLHQRQHYLCKWPMNKQSGA